MTVDTQELIVAEVATEEAQDQDAGQQQPPQQKDDAFDAEDFYNEETSEQQQAEQQEGADGEQGEGGEGQPEPIEAPLSWAKDAKEVFAGLPREAQEIIAARERDREQGVRMKMQEAANTRQAVETEARQALQTIMQNHAQQLEPLLAQYNPVQPDLRLLNSSDPAHRDLYFQQEAEYRHAVAQRETITQRMQEAQRNAEMIAQQQADAELQAEHHLLTEKLGTEWSDPSTRAKLLTDLQPIAAELGYPAELIAQARGVDILAMKNAMTWKAKADKLDALNKTKMVPVRAARAIPPATRSGSPTGQRQPADPIAEMYPDDVRRN